MARRRSGLAVLVVLGLAITATFAGQGWLIARVLGAVLSGDTGSAVVAAAAGIAVLQVARAVLVWGRERLGATIGGRIKDDVRGRLLDRLFALGPGYTTGTRTGRLQSTLVDGVEALEAYFVAFLPQLVSSLLGAVVLITYVWWLDPIVGVTVAACGVLVAVAPRVSRRVMSKPMERWWAAYRGVYADTLDVLQGMVTLKGVNAHRRRGEQLRAQSEQFAVTSTRLVAATAGYELVVGLAAGAGTGLAVGVGALRTASGALDVATLLIILLLSRECFRPLTDLGKAFHAASPGIAAAEGVFALLDEQPAVTDPDNPVTASLKNPPRVRLDGVTFAYGPEHPPALRDVSFTAEAGVTTALVGRSGAGKSTVVALLLRFFDPQQGTVTVDGRDLSLLPLSDLRSLISVVSQDTYLFHGTVRDNLLLAAPGADHDVVEAATRAAAAHDFITALPQGYDTMIGERGARLSGGERQRIAIARALLKDAPILLLDEATSAIDAANEAAIQAALDRLTVHRTTLVIAHRLSTVRDAGHVVVLDDGQVAEDGPPDRLLATRGAYHRLVAAQAGAA
ncbi:HlyB/MsbA family ABC transporter [Actinoplanes sp. NBRC 103695]|nr:HlyB/MsbA family ABC transporter [Actinoplanes sp. NBRC 103695]